MIPKVYKYADRIIEFADSQIAKDLTKKVTKLLLINPKYYKIKPARKEIANLLNKNNAMELDFKI
ncbi:hypothetical protein ACEW7V_03200 [Areca yellow leaf disease phytoplasma]|uniref:hypothetical protein n=1 Tax=Areca yellow leaf disease phytoplasma TaxID=927614 RepID=UPI0035B53B52